jgi:hypothetical protein
MVPVFQRCYDALTGGYADRNLIYLSPAVFPTGLVFL